MIESLPAIAVSAKTRALSSRLSFFCAAACRTIGFQICGPEMNQNRAMSVCSAVRLVLLSPPSSPLSFTSLVQVSESRAGGGGGRNCDALVMIQGVVALTLELIGITVGT